MKLEKKTIKLFATLRVVLVIFCDSVIVMIFLPTLITATLK